MSDEDAKQELVALAKYSNVLADCLRILGGGCCGIDTVCDGAGDAAPGDLGA